MNLKAKIESKGIKTHANKKTFKNKNGILKIGDTVQFQVENQNMWCGDLEGVITYIGGRFAIKTKKSGLLSIDEGYDVYGNTIRKI